MPDVIDVANYILEICSEEFDDGEYELISHMKLQKLLYFCQGYSLVLLEKPLFNENIEAWTHGPVCPKLYHLLKIYGPSPITTVIDPARIHLDIHEKNLVRMVYDYYGQYSASRLRKITHENGPWKDVPVSTTIPLDLMKKYFEMLIDADSQPWTDEERKRTVKILEEAERSGEIDLSQFSVPMGA